VDRWAILLGVAASVLVLAYLVAGGPYATQVAIVLDQFGTALVHSGDLNERHNGRMLLERSVEMLRHLVPADHAKLTLAREHLGRVLMRSDEREAAVALVPPERPRVDELLGHEQP